MDHHHVPPSNLITTKLNLLFSLAMASCLPSSPSVSVPLFLIYAIASLTTAIHTFQFILAILGRIVLSYSTTSYHHHR